MHKCPECGKLLILFANGDNGPHEDRWTCETCGIEYPHCEFPLPKGYIKQAREAEKTQELERQKDDDRRALDAWNKWARSTSNG